MRSALPELTNVWAETFPDLSRPVSPRRTPAPRLLALNDDVAHDVSLDPDVLRTDEGVRFLTGERPAPGATPVAQVYAGHQWGVYKPLLGDGRAALLGERPRHSGGFADVHTKGIGPTSMSRVDGFATVGPMLREYLLGEAMHALGLPTTRALAVVATGAPRRFNGEMLPGAILTRVAASHIRYGSIEYAASLGDPQLLRRLVAHALERHYPGVAAGRYPARAFLDSVVGAAALQTAGWMGVGFVHGVLSTDNVLVSGETIDYGPCAFLDAYDPDAVFSSIDLHGRYAFRRQPEIMRWNLGRLAHALAGVLADDIDDGRAIGDEVVSTFDERYIAAWTGVFRTKLGLDASIDSSTVDRFAAEALSLLAAYRVDFTGFWRDLATAARGDSTAVRGAFPPAAASAVDAWLEGWSALQPDADRLATTNAVYIPRNHIVDDALKAAVAGDLDPVHELVELLRNPYTERHTSLARRLAAPPTTEVPFVTFCGT
ncbi:protein adenylyltransferase SelO [Microbacterium trichothecenolyticum]|uniref:Protein nucleotidyltransferase YdiU n=1 Tax=Microbacterium trichothecenolyticum TaxID=69370 RepID=A0ABU0U077_MICTR|nr:protein adenylyltransferase SelO family protein [Microbacterium trichothecenolyticum]MDQ1124579.1 uncharacterized protein YdiU (UPF0061 family) [Microbacterium trichothecenolyticum]